MSLEAISKDVVRGEGRYRQNQEERRSHFETVQYRKDGTEMFLEVNASTILYQGQLMVLSINRDVTERRRAEKALREAELKYRSIFENAVEGIFQSTPEGRFIAANPALARMLWIRLTEDLMNWRTDIAREHYVEPQSREEFLRTMDQDGFVRFFEREVYRKDHSKIWISESVRAVRDQTGTVVYYEGTSSRYHRTQAS